MSQNVKTVEKLLEDALTASLQREREALNEVKEATRVLAQFALEAKKIADGKIEELETRVTKRIKEIKDGKDGKNGRDGAKGDKGDRGEPGKDGRDGFDADPNETADIVLRKLKLPDIPNYQPFIDRLEKRIDELAELIKKMRKERQSTDGGGGTTLFGSVGHSPVHETFTMNGSDTSVTLRKGVAAQGTAIMVRYQGQMLDLTSQYTVNGNKVTFIGFTPEADTIISVTYWG